MDEQKYFQVPDEVVDLRKQLTDLTLAYDQLGKDYEERRKSLAFSEAKNSQLQREKDEAVKQLNDFTEYARAEMDQIKNVIIEVPCKTLYGLAFDWQYPSDSVFITIDEDGVVNLRTRQELAEKKKQAEDPNWHPPYRHWWLTKVCDVQSG